MTIRLIKADQVAELLDVSPARIYELTRERKIPFVQIGERQYRYSEAAILDWINRGGSRPASKNEIFGLDA